MPVTLTEMMEGLSPRRRAKIDREASRIIAESRNLAELRKTVGMTQKALANQLAITQASLSEIESREDTKISTLARMVEGLGGRLRLYAEMPGGVQVPLALGSKRAVPKRKSGALDRPMAKARGARTRSS